MAESPACFNSRIRSKVDSLLWSLNLSLLIRKFIHPSLELRPASLLLFLLLSVGLVVLFLYKFGGMFVFGRVPPGHSAAEVELHYGIVMDAGSSGTRAYLYYWPEHSGDKRELLRIQPLLQDGEPMVKKVTPGLSSLAETPDNAFEYLRPLLQFASDNIPTSSHKETPLYILATAGMRLVEKTQQEKILSNLRNGIRQNFSFYFPEEHLEIISGKQEGIYQWLAINFVLGRLSHRQPGDGAVELIAVEQGHGGENMVLRPRTVGAIDMGGASLQVAMEITTNLQLEGMSEKDKSQVVEINLGCTEHDTEHTYRLFVMTYLGFGANEAMARHHRHLLIENLDTDANGLDPRHRIKDPCRPIGMKDNITLNLDLEALNVEPVHKTKLSEAQEIHLYGSGEWDTCYARIQNYTKAADKFVSCNQNCPDPGMRIPPIQFDNSEFFGFSEFWYSMEDVLGMGGKYMFYKYRTASKDFCATRWLTTWARFLQGLYQNSDTERLQTQCFKSVWLTVALHEGLTFPKSYGHLSAAPNTVNGQVVHWTLGALLYRTRFFPVRAVERLGQGAGRQHHSLLEAGYLSSSPLIFWLCLAAVSLIITLVLLRLSRYVRPSSLRKVPSLAVFATSPKEIAEEEQSLIRDQDYLYAHTKVFVG